MTEQTQAPWPPPPPPPLPARPKPFHETTLGGIVIALAIVVGIFVAAYVWYVNSGDDDSATVVCNGDGSSVTCTRY